MTPSTLMFVGLPGGPELLIIMLLAILLFGASKLPKLARSMGAAQGEFEKGRTEVERELQEITDKNAETKTPERAHN